jgi:hypothetical protein
MARLIEHTSRFAEATFAMASGQFQASWGGADRESLQYTVALMLFERSGKWRGIVYDA